MQTTDTVVLSNMMNIVKLPDPLNDIKENAFKSAFLLAKELGVKDVRDYLQTRLNERSLVGIQKYGTSLSDAELSKGTLLAHALEECLDLANYIEAILQK